MSNQFIRASVAVLSSSSNNAVYLFTLSSSDKLYEGRQNRVQGNKRDVLNRSLF